MFFSNDLIFIKVRQCRKEWKGLEYLVLGISLSVKTLFPQSEFVTSIDTIEMAAFFNISIECHHRSRKQNPLGLLLQVEPLLGLIATWLKSYRSANQTSAYILC
jgi:hypothetical protein